MIKLSNIKISNKLITINLITLFGLLVISAAYLLGEKRVASIDTNIKILVEKIENINHVNYYFLNARRNEKDFIIRKDKKYLGKHDKSGGKLKDAIAAMMNMPKSEREKQDLVFVGVKYDEYEVAFKALAHDLVLRGLTPKQGLEGSLRNSVHEVESEIKKANQIELGYIMLMMRRHEKDFLMRRDEKYIKRMDERVGEFKNKLEFVVFDDELLGKLTKFIDAYHRDFNALAKVELKLKKDAKVLSAVFSEVEPVLKDLVQYYETKYVSARQQQHDITQQIRMLIIATVLIVIILSAASSFIIGRNISKPVNGITAIMRRLSEDDLDVEVLYNDRSDEIGQMAQAVAVFKENAIVGKEMRAQKRLEEQDKIEQAEKMRNMTIEFEKDVSDVIALLVSDVRDLEKTAQRMTEIAEVTNEKSSLIKGQSINTSENIQSVAGATEELSASIAELSSQVALSSQAARMAVNDVDSASKQIGGLSEAAQEIGGVIGLIHEIAEQTNLLALNATIESARAGEAGKGFAVVANEVKTLASETAKATDDISARIEDIQTKTHDTVGAIQSIESKIKDLEAASTSISAAFEEQTAATSEISRSTQISSENVKDMEHNINEVSGAAGSAGEAADLVLSAAHKLNEQSSVLRDKIERFLKEVG